MTTDTDSSRGEAVRPVSEPEIDCVMDAIGYSRDDALIRHVVSKVLASLSTPTAQTEGNGLAEELKQGDTFKAEGADFWTSGIDVGEHGNCIEVYGVTEEDANSLRDRILTALRTQEASQGEEK